jgi:hypothetical protein
MILTPPFISLTLMVFEEYAIDIPQNSRCYRILVHLLPGGPHTLWRIQDPLKYYQNLKLGILFHGLVVSKQIGSYFQDWWPHIQHQHWLAPLTLQKKTIYANQGHHITLYVPGEMLGSLNLGCTKIDMPKYNITIIWTPIYECYMVGCGCKNGYQQICG